VISLSVQRSHKIFKVFRAFIEVGFAHESLLQLGHNLLVRVPIGRGGRTHWKEIGQEGGKKSQKKEKF